MGKVVVITSGGTGVGRATADEFARQGYDIALLSREPERLMHGAEQIEAAFGVRALAVPTDVADARAVDDAATQVEETLGPIDVWINVAMATVFAPVSSLTAEEIERGTKVTYLGQVHGMMVALSRMRESNRGTIVNVGSALGYRSVPLQSIYCGAKFAIHGFTVALRSEIIHDGLDVHLTMVDLPAVNTPQFDWSATRWASARGLALRFTNQKSPPGQSTFPLRIGVTRSGYAFRPSRPSSPIASRSHRSIAIWPGPAIAVSSQTNRCIHRRAR